MANYAKVTDFATKDTLPSGDPAKIVKGTEIDVEFEAIQTAVATKVNNSGNETIAGIKTFTSNIVASGGVTGNLTGNADTATNATTVTNGVYTTGAQTITGVKRGAITTDNDLSFDLNAAHNFQCTTSGNGTLTFTNIASAAGQSGFIELINASNHVISKAATTRVDSNFLSIVSATGTYLISYFCDGTNVFCATTGATS